VAEISKSVHQRLKQKEVVLNWIFYLDDLEIEEPVNWSDIEISIMRDEKLHGIVTKATTSTLQFQGADAIDYLTSQKDAFGVKADVTFRALAACDNYDYEEIVSGRLNFGKYKKSCGTNCIINLPWEDNSCEIVLKSRLDQKVDVDKAVGVDGMTPLPSYLWLGVETELPAHELKVGTEGYVEDAGDAIDLDIFAEAFAKSFVRPTYARAIDESLETSELSPSVFAASNNGLNDSALSPQLLLDDSSTVDCFDGNFDYEVRLKGSFDILYYYGNGNPTPPVTNIFRFKAAVGVGDWNENQNPESPPFPPIINILHQTDINPGSDINHWVGTFDISWSGTTTIDPGKGFWAFLTWEPTGPSNGVKMIGNITFDKETYVKVQSVKSCPATNAELYMVHEALSRITEAVTNGCIRLKSSYYGRTDSQPFSFPNDGCGGLRTVTSGLKIRRAQEDKFFASVNDILEGQRVIDNIGAEIIPDTIPGAHLLVVEDLDYFYRDTEILRHDGVPEADTEIEESRHYSRVQVGYKKWEVEDINGLDEFNSNREYNTSLDTVNTPLDITSTLVAGSYPIEVTRQQSFATTGAADTKYDNEVFLICMRRTSYPYGNIEVEIGNVDNTSNIFSPNTIYNFRISPIRNLMRWYKSIASGFTSLFDTMNKLFFSSGTGNLTAYGEMTDATCRVENQALQENQNVFVTQFADPADYTPLWKNETITYAYPMSVSDYKTIKNNPYGYISVQCGNGDFVKYWIKEIKYRIGRGTADFILRKKYAQ